MDVEVVEVACWDYKIFRDNGHPYCLWIPRYSLEAVTGRDRFEKYQQTLNRARLDGDSVVLIGPGVRVRLLGCPQQVQCLLAEYMPIFLDAGERKGIVLFASQFSLSIDPSLSDEAVLKGYEKIDLRKSEGFGSFTSLVIGAVSLQYALIVPILMPLETLTSPRPALVTSPSVAIAGCLSIVAAHLVARRHLRAAQALLCAGLTCVISPALVSVGEIAASPLLQGAFMGAVFGGAVAMALKVATWALPSPEPETIRAGTTAPARNPIPQGERLVEGMPGASAGQGAPGG